MQLNYFTVIFLRSALKLYWIGPEEPLGHINLTLEVVAFYLFIYFTICLCIWLLWVRSLL